jgi:hypothetical protein
MALNLDQHSIVLVFISAGVASGASGWGVDSQGHVHKIPSNNPEAFQQAVLAASLLSHAGTLQDAGLSRQANELGESLARAVAPKLQKAFAPGA